jgi:NADPH:quinone reductase-like Zn-dependent oxidoreductase
VTIRTSRSEISVVDAARRESDRTVDLVRAIETWAKGIAKTLACFRASLKPGGAYIATDGWANIALSIVTRRASKRVLFPIPPRYHKADVVFLRRLIETGRYRPIIDRCYSFEGVVEATRYVETEQKLGNVVLTIAHNEPS